MPTELELRPIRLPDDFDLCLAFRIDSYVCSFGTADRFHGRDGLGAERYRESLTRKCELRPESCVHVWQDARIVGQVEMGPWKEDPSLGYVNLYYVRPEHRGKGLGKAIDDHVVRYLRSLDLRSARLSVSVTNHAAIRFYTLCGWTVVGLRADMPGVFLMKRDLVGPGS